MTQMAIICNREDSFMPTLIMGSSGIAIGNEVSIFITPGGSKAFLKGELEKNRELKGLPDPVELFDTIMDQGGTFILCELALENKDIDPKDLRDDRIKVMGAPPWLMDIDEATITFSF